MPEPSHTHLFQPLQAVPPKPFHRFRHVGDGRTVPRKEDASTRVPHSLQRTKVVADTSRVFPDPGGVPPPQEEVPHEESVGPYPMEGEMVSSVPGHFQDHQFSLISGYAVSFPQGLHLDRSARGRVIGCRSQDPSPGFSRQPWRGSGVVPMRVGKKNRHFSGSIEGRDKGPDVCIHVRARIDDGHLPVAHEESAGPVQGKGSLVVSFDDSRFQGPETSAPLGHELLGEFVRHSADGNLVFRSERVGLHGVEIDHSEDVVPCPNQDHHL